MSDKQKLQNLIQKIDELVKRYVSASDPDFCAWRTSVNRLLLKRFGEKSFEYKTFKDMHFSLRCFTTSTPDHAWNDACVSELQRAKAILMTYVDDMDDDADKCGNHHRMYDYDVFLSHACKNKATLVDSLHGCLAKLGVTVWYDTTELEWGDNWKEKIHEGLQKCQFAIVVLSPEFINREWTEKELFELLNRQDERNHKLVLPLLYNLTIEEMKERYPALESIQVYALSKEDDVKDITIKFGRIFIKELKSVMQS